MNFTSSHGSRRSRSALHLFPFLLLPLLLFADSSGATCRAQQTPTGTQAQLPAAPVLVKLPVLVMNEKRQLIGGLTKDDFSVREGKTEHEISYFQSGAAPASVAVLVDVSGSVEKRTTVAVKHAVAKFVELAHAENEYFVGEFSTERRALVNWTRDTREILQGLEKLAAAPQGSKPKPRGQTALYDACAAALDVLAGRPNHARVLLLFSDGVDNQSRLSFTQLRGKVAGSGVQLYSINIRDSSVFYENTLLQAAGQAILEELASVSGGGSFAPQNPADKKELENGVARIASELRHQYVVGFTPGNLAPGGKWNKIKIKLTTRNPHLKGLSVRSREGYFSPASTPAP